MKCSNIAIRILLSTLAASSSCSAFVTPHASSSSSSRSIQQSKSIHTTSTTTTTRTMLNAIPELMDLNVNLDHLASQYDGAMQQIIASSSHLISDASAAVATMDGDAVGTAVKEEGWWDQYLNLYKSLLLFVHTTIDTPLRSGGWDQTWGIAIASFTALVRTALLPLSIQQTKSAEYIKALKPYQDEIKEKFKDDKEMLNRATAKLFEDANANPLAGCLISILQLPILIGLYRSITLLAKEGLLEEPFLWIPSLEGPVTAANDYRGMQWLTEGWVDNHPSMGWEATLAFLVMPIILVIGQSVTMSVLTPGVDTEKMTQDEKEQTEKTQGFLKFLPLMIGYFSLQVPAGLTIYWFTSNIYSLAQSLTIRKYYEANPPEIDLPDYWDALDDVASMSPEEQRKAAEAGMAVGPKWQDILDEAKFHYRVERKGMRENSEAWKTVLAMTAVGTVGGADDGTDAGVPQEMLAWVHGTVNADSGALEQANDLKTAQA